MVVKPQCMVVKEVTHSVEICTIKLQIQQKIKAIHTIKLQVQQNLK